MFLKQFSSKLVNSCPSSLSKYYVWQLQHKTVKAEMPIKNFIRGILTLESGWKGSVVNMTWMH